MRLRLLGTWALSTTPELPSRSVSRDARRVLALVALRGSTTREDIRATLWPDVGEASSAARLRNALWRLSKTRQTLLEERSGSIALAPGVGLDVDEMFRVATAVDAGLAGGGAQQFAADLLPGWDEDWPFLDRERIRQARLHALERMSQTLREEGNHAAALDAAPSRLSTRTTGGSTLLRKARHLAPTGPDDPAPTGGPMPSGFHSGSRSLQDRFETRALADRIDGRLVTDSIGDDDRAFIAARDMFFLATADADGRPTCSYKGGEPGFVRVLDRRTLAFPSYDGNGMYLSAGNVLVNPNVGMLFLDFERGHRMRLEGTASIDHDDALQGDYPEAQFVVRVLARAVYPNCPRYVHRYQLVRRSRFVPRRGCLTPVPEWKRSDWAFDALPEHDPARDVGDRDVLGR